MGIRLFSTSAWSIETTEKTKHLINGRNNPRTHPKPKLNIKQAKKSKRTEITYPNPNPYRFKIVKAESHGDYLILLVNYPDCPTWGGNKILVYKGLTLIDLANLQNKHLDPHFSDDGRLSPIARFSPAADKALEEGSSRILDDSRIFVLAKIESDKKKEKDNDSQA